MRHAPVLALAAALPFLAACAGEPPSFADRLEAESGAVAEIGADWRDGAAQIREGRALVADGREDVEAGEDRVAEGRAKIRRGEALIRAGSDAQVDAESAYRARRAASADG